MRVRNPSGVTYHLGKFAVSHAAVGVAEQLTHEGRQHAPLLNQAFNALNIAGLAEMAQIGAMGAGYTGAASLLGAFAHAGTITGLGLGYVWGMSQVPQILYGSFYDSYTFRNREHSYDPSEMTRVMRRDLFAHKHMPNLDDPRLNAANTPLINHKDARDFIKSQFSSFADIGYSQGYAPHVFYDVLRATGLVETYAQSHPDAHLDTKVMRGEIGGISSKIGRIKGLKDSPVDALYDEHVICMPAPDGGLPFSDNELRTLLSELSEGIYLHQAYPFFSLHFNHDNMMYPVLNPVYENTLVGHVIGFLDYFMKGFISGGIFDKDFLLEWANNPKVDRVFLKSKLIDLKKEFKKNKQAYTSLREKMHSMGFESGSVQVNSEKFWSIINKQFSTSFRITARQKEIIHSDNLIVMNPDFDIEYTINVLPEYQQYLNQYKLAHGSYPDDYQKLLKLYEQECEEIRIQMSRLPLFRDYFRMLGCINFFCYYLTTLKDMGKVPDLFQGNMKHIHSFPKVMPPIPVRYYKEFKLNITTDMLIKKLLEIDKSATNNYFKGCIDDPDKVLPIKLEDGLKNYLLQELSSDFPLNTWDEGNSSEIISTLINTFSIDMKRHLLNIKSEFMADLQKLADINQLGIKLDPLQAISVNMDLLRKSGLSKIAELIKSNNNKNRAEAERKFIELVVKYESALAEIGSRLSGSKKLGSESLVPSIELTTLDLNDGSPVSDNLNLMGGCGLWLKGVRQKRLDDNGQFSSLIHGSMTGVSAETQKIKKVNGKDYSVFRLRNRFSPGSILTDYNSMASASSSSDAIMGDAEFTLLAELGYESLTGNHAEISTYNLAAIDKKGQTLIHYMAGFATEIQLEHVIKDNHTTTLIKDSFGNLPIDIAASSGNVGAVKYFIKHNIGQIHTKNVNGSTPLLSAAAAGQTEVVKLLIDAGANAAELMPNGLNAVMLAILSGIDDTAIALINSHKANLNLSLPNGSTPLHLAIDMGRPKVSLALIAAGADCTLKRKYDGYSPIHCAVRSNLTEVCEVIALKHKFNVNETLASGESVTHLAAKSGSFETLKWLIESAQANPDARDAAGNSTIMAALNNGKFEAAKYLASRCGINIVNNKGQTASLLASSLGQFDIADILVRRGESHLISDQSGNNYIYYLLRSGQYHRYQALRPDIQLTFNSLSGLDVAAQYGHKELIDSFVDAQCKFSLEAVTGWDLIHYAVKADHIGYLKRWMRDHTDIYSPILLGEDKGKSLAWIAAENGSFLCLRQLLKSLDSVSIANAFGDKHLLCAAAKSGSNRVFDLMLKKCGDINVVVDSDGDTVAHVAAQFGMVNIIKHAKSRGLDLLARNKNGFTCLHIAIKNHDKYLLRVILKLIAPAKCPNDVVDYALREKNKGCLKVLSEFNVQSQQLNSALNHAHLKEIIDNQSNLSSNKLKDELIDALYKSDEIKFIDLLDKIDFDLELFTLGTHELPLLQIAFMLEAEWAIRILLNRSADPLSADSNGLNLFHIIAKESKDKAGRLMALVDKCIPLSKSDLLFGATKGGNSVLLIAAYNNNLALFENNMNIESHTFRLKDGNTLLHQAVKAGDIKLVKGLLKKGVLVNTVNNKQVTPLMIAAASGNDEIMQLLLINGADPDMRDIYQNTALHYAISSQKLICSLSLIFLMRDINIRNRKGNTPFNIAAAHGMKPVLSTILNLDPRSNLTNKSGQNALHLAAQSDHLDSVKYLLENGFDIDEQTQPKNSNLPKSTALHLAARQGNIEMCQFLISSGASLELDDDQKEALVSCLFASKYSGITKLLNVLQVDLVPEHLLLASAANNIDMIGNLLMLGFPINAKNLFGQNALHIACASKSEQAATFLIDAEIGIDEIDQDGNNPLHIAVMNGSVYLSRLLCLRQSSIDTPNYAGKTALHLACMQGQFSIVLLLLKHGAKFDVVDKDGITPSQIAAAHGYFEIAKLLTVFGDQSLSATTTEILPSHVKAKIEAYDGEVSVIRGSILEVTSTQSNCIHHAVTLGQHESLELLCMMRSEKIDEVNSNGETPLDLAMRMGNLDAVNTLKKYNAHNKIANVDDLQQVSQATMHAVLFSPDSSMKNLVSEQVNTVKPN